MKLFLKSLILLMLINSCTSEGQNYIVNQRVEYQIDPIGIDIKKPRFFWEIQDINRGAKQTAYQILVSSSIKKLNINEADVWNSGKVTSDQSAHVAYSGSELKSYKTYFWKVKIWDDKNMESSFSQTARWEMGILSKDEWQAKWIGKAIKVEVKEKRQWLWKQWFWHPTEKAKNVPVYFRKKINLPSDKKVTSALIRMTADNRFTLYFNNVDIGSGNYLPNIYDYDVTDYIKNENIIAIQAANTYDDKSGVLFGLKINFDDGSELYIDTDESENDWKTTNKVFNGWERLDFDDLGWRKIKLLGDYETGPWEKIDNQEIFEAPRPVLVRNEIKIDKKIKRARAYVTGLGGYVMHINGKRVGDAVLAPGWTQYQKRIQYQTFDVGNLLHKGKNALGAILGNQWWSSNLGWRGTNYYSKGPLRFFLQLLVDYQDGSSQIFITDKDWKVHNSPILKTSLYNGEKYDARLEEKGWDKINFDDSVWDQVAELNNQKGKLVAQKGPLLRITKEIKPVKITSPSNGVFVVDMGQNFAGWVKLKIQGKTGTHIKMRFAETLKKDGNVFRGNLRRAKATDDYILKGDSIEEWQPSFTYHGFRYVELTGFPGKPGLDAITGLVVHSDAPQIGEFSTSDTLINKIQQNILWSQRSNMYSVPTDCPQRDERLGWTGDAQTFAPTASYNMEMINFFNKWMNDITDGQEEDGSIHNVHPTIEVKTAAKPGWGDAIYVVPWVMYKFYGDQRILEENYDAIIAWVEYMRSKSEGNLYERRGFGDWVSVEKSPSEPIGSAYYFYAAKIVSKMAGILGKIEDEKKYQELSLKIAEAYNEKHFDVTKSTYTGNTQTANLIPLSFGIVPKEHEASVAATIATDVKTKDNHITTGFLGIPLLLPILSDYGYNDLAYTLATQKTYPSWGYTIEKGATSIWELWNGDTADPTMNSRNHFALGAVGGWFYGYLAGIRPTPEAPGFKKIILSPMPAQSLNWAKASVKTTYGMVSSAWKRKENTITYNFSIPVNTTAEFHLPFLKNGISKVKEGDAIIYQNDKFSLTDDFKLIEDNKTAAVILLGSGMYKFVVNYK